jgi:protein SCO1/2
MRPRKPFILLVTFAAMLTASTADAQLNTGIPSEVEGVGVDQNLGQALPLNVLVTDSKGVKQRLGSYFGNERPVLVTLNYSDCPMLCSLQLNQLVATLDTMKLRIGKDFDLVTLSIDPKESTQKIGETKRKYIDLLPNQSGASRGWHFVTASQDVITQVTGVLGFRYRYDKLTKEYYHPAMLAFVSPDGVITRYSLDVTFPEDQMKMALIEASNGTVGGVVDQFLMLCFRYDAERNRYVASAWKLMRLGGLVTVGLLLATLTPFWFGRRRMARNEKSGPELNTITEN